MTHIAQISGVTVVTGVLPSGDIMEGSPELIKEVRVLLTVI